MGSSLPALMRLDERFRERRDEFVILAFHDGSVASFEELDEKLAPIIENSWKGKPLPFPILLDSTGETIKTWGIRAFPTAVLIDPEGKIVSKAGDETLAEILSGKDR